MHYPTIRAAVVAATSALILSACSKPSDQAEAETTDEAAAVAETSEDTSGIESVEQRASYAIGHNLGSSIKRQGGLELNRELLLQGVEDGLAGEDAKIDQQQISEAFAVLKERAEAKTAILAEENLKIAEEYLAENAAREGVMVTESGLQYEVITEGVGMKPTTQNKVEVHYHGTLLDGTVFDSSVERDKTAEFPVTGVISGWTEALQLMPIGSKWRLFIPPGLAYGAADRGTIPPNSALIFEVELIAIKQP